MDSVDHYSSVNRGPVILVPLIGVPLIGVPLIGVPQIGVRLYSISRAYASYLAFNCEAKVAEG